VYFGRGINMNHLDAVLSITFEHPRCDHRVALVPLTVLNEIGLNRSAREPTVVTSAHLRLCRGQRRPTSS
jgi:hypothetical protein